METMEIKPTEKFPADFKVYRVGDNIKLVDAKIRAGKFYKVVNRNRILDIEKQDTTKWLLAAAGTHNPGDISDWLEPEDGVLYILAFGLYSDRNIKVTIGIPAAETLYGTRDDPEATVTPSISPYNEPTVTFYAWGKAMIPSFKLENPTEYTNMALKFLVKGYKYLLEEIARPPVFDTLDITHITRG